MVVGKEEEEEEEEEKGGGGGARGKNELLPLTRRAHDRVLLRQKQSWCRRRASDGLVKSFLRETRNTIFAYDLFFKQNGFVRLKRA